MLHDGDRVEMDDYRAIWNFRSQSGHNLCFPGHTQMLFGHVWDALTLIHA